MSLEECKRKAEKKKQENRLARGRVEDTSVSVYLSWSTLFDEWKVDLCAYGESSGEGFSQKESAVRYFEELVQKHNLKEEAWPVWKS